MQDTPGKAGTSLGHVDFVTVEFAGLLYGRIQTEVGKLHAELKVSFPAYQKVFSKITTQTSLKLLEAYPLAADMLAAPKDRIVETIPHGTQDPSG